MRMRASRSNAAPTLGYVSMLLWFILIVENRNKKLLAYLRHQEMLDREFLARLVMIRITES